MSLTDKKLDFWIQNDYNVILRGKHGVGKTAVIKDAFERNGLKWMYFSASTMDPWVDFIGVPKERTEGDKTYLDLVRPKAFAEDDVEALFFDEYNRSAPKIRNAVMELIQFKSINGKKFNNLKLVWAAINPEEENEDDGLQYNVEPVDPAQLDRFHVIVDVPYSLDRAYFKRKYDMKTANAVVSWWNSLDKKIKLKVSPRRMDYAIDMLTKNGDIRDVLPKGANVQKLIAEINEGAFSEQVKNLVKKNDPNEIKNWISNENNFQNAIGVISKKELYMKTFFPHLEEEKLVTLLSKDNKVFNFVCSNEADYSKVLMEIVASKTNKRLANKIKKSTSIGDVNKNSVTFSKINTMSHTDLKSYMDSNNITPFEKILQKNCKEWEYNSPKKIQKRLKEDQTDGTVSIKDLVEKDGDFKSIATTYYKYKAIEKVWDRMCPSATFEDHFCFFKYLICNLTPNTQLGTLQSKYNNSYSHLKYLIMFSFDKLVQKRDEAVFNTNANEEMVNNLYKGYYTLVIALYGDSKLRKILGV